MLRIVSASLLIAFLLSACDAGDSVDHRGLAIGNKVKSQLRGYDLGPPFPAGLRDSGLVNGYAEGEWVPFAAVMEGRKLEVADSLDGESGNGVYRASIILPTYSPRNGANGISDLAVTGTYGEGEVAPIPDPFDSGWLEDNGYWPYVLGAYTDQGDVDPAPTILSVSQRSGPTRFGGNVASVSVPIEFTAPADASRVELLFAVRLAPPDLEPIQPGGQEFPGTAAGSAAGAGDFFPGPGPIFVGYEVGKPTGIATVPIRVERHSCESSDECASGESCTVENCKKIEDSDLGETGQPIAVGDGTVTIDHWTTKGDGTGYVGFKFSADGVDVKFRVTAGGQTYYGTSDSWESPDGVTGDAITSISFCPVGGGEGECDHPCVDDSNCPTDDICEDGICQPPPPSCDGDEDCNGDICVGGYCVPECPESCGDPEFCDPSPCMPPDGGEPPCITDAQCENGQVCEDGVCQPENPPCDMSCPEGESCQDGVCQVPPPPCTDDSDCPGGEVCASGTCHPGNPPCDGANCAPCEFDSDCPGGEACEGGTCVQLQPPQPCVNDNECPTDQSCEGGFCTPPPEGCGPMGECGPGELCETDSGSCEPTYPPVPCADDTECPSGDSCVGGYCQGGGCTSDNECGADDVCNNGVCVPPPNSCTSGSECASGICDGGFCAPEHPPVPCTDVGDCPGGDVCLDGYCTPDGGGCHNNNQCGADDVCNSGVCTPPPQSCTSGDECDSGQCESGFCVPEHPPVPCTDVSDCPAGSDDVCSGGYCVPPYPPCTTGGDCDSGVCGDDGYCVPEHPPVPCTTASDCPAGSDDVYLPTCDGGFCRPPQTCDNDSDCDGGYVCDDSGLCEPGQPPTPCTVDSDCPPGSDDVYVPTCIGGFCTPSDGGCSVDTDCPGGDVCLDGGCVPANEPTPCTTQYDCGGGALCTGGYCEPGDGLIECVTADDCPPNPGDDVGPACVNGVCSNSRLMLRSCTASTDCSVGYGCTDGICQPLSGACEVDGDCDAGSCIAGWCGRSCLSGDDCEAGETCALGRCASACTDYSVCGDYETCLGGGCQPVMVAVARLRSGRDPWDVDVPDAGNHDLGGGCSASGDAGGAGTALLLLLAVSFLGMSRRREGGSASCMVALLAVAAAAAGGCSFGGSSGKSGNGDKTPDASTGGGGGGGGGGADGGVPSDPESPYLLVTCSATGSSYAELPDAAVPDAGMPDAAPAPDAAPEGAPDAGTGDAIDSPCCNPSGMCPGDLACIAGPGEEHRCRPRCEAETRACPSGSICADFGADAYCIPASTEGADCAPELCDAATVCVGDSADTATCHRRCEDETDCEDGQSCDPIVGSDSKACF